MSSRRKLILFDIDGTLITPGQIPRTAMAAAIGNFLGRKIELAFEDVAGFTDLTIIRDAVARVDGARRLTGDDMDHITGDFLAMVADRLPGSNAVKVFPGAAELVQACRAEDWVVALLTGNVERGARLKLANTGLWDLFAFGVFGDDGNSREDLPWVARERAWDTLGVAFIPADTILIGDTPNDARIAHLNNTSSLIVCRRDDPGWRAAIQAQHPTWLVDDFEDVPRLMEMMRRDSR